MPNVPLRLSTRGHDALDELSFRFLLEPKVPSLQRSGEGVPILTIGGGERVIFLYPVKNCRIQFGMSLR